MEVTHSSLTPFVGMRLNRNVYNRFGVLVLPACSILTEGNLGLLQEHQVQLFEEDVEETAVSVLVNTAITEFANVFHMSRKFNRVSIEGFRDIIIPMIESLSLRVDLNRNLAYMEKRDEYTYCHSIGVALISRFIGIVNGLTEYELHELTLAAFLHDIGKTRISEDIVNKPKTLSACEYTEMKRHTLYGYEIIARSQGLPRRCALVALQHHEREDGSGYPFGISRSEIDYYSKIVAIADMFHAMVSKRVYKDPLPLHQALQDLSRSAYGLLEPEITLRFVTTIMEMMIGNRVVLSNGHEGKIMSVNPKDPVHPLVKVGGRFVDLSRTDALRLEGII